MSETYVQVPTNGNGEKIGVSQLSNGADNVDLQHIVLADDTTYAARAKVGNAVPGSADYGLTVRIAAAAVSTYHVVSAGSNNAANIKNAAGTLYAVSVYNNANYPVFVKFYEKATSPAPGSDTVKKTVGVQAGTPRDVAMPIGGIHFATGISIAIVKGIGETDNTAVLASDCVVDVCYL